TLAAGALAGVFWVSMPPWRIWVFIVPGVAAGLLPSSPGAPGPGSLLQPDPMATLAVALLAGTALSCRRAMRFRGPPPPPRPAPGPAPGASPARGRPPRRPRWGAPAAARAGPSASGPPPPPAGAAPCALRRARRPPRAPRPAGTAGGRTRPPAPRPA